MGWYRRADWGAAPPRQPLTPAVEPGVSLVVHHTGGGAAPATVDDAMAMLRGIQRSHQAGEYVDIAYNVAVDNLGNLYECRGLEHLGGATYGANSTTRAVVWLGGSDVTAPTPEALQAIAWLHRANVGVQLTADATITGHRDWTQTACPGEALYGLLPEIRRLSAAAATPTPTQEDDMAVTIIEAAARPGGFGGREVWDLVISGPATLGGTQVQSAVAIMPVDPADAPFNVEIHCHGGGVGSVDVVQVDASVAFWSVPRTGRVSVVTPRPVRVHGREVHHAVSR